LIYTLDQSSPTPETKGKAHERGVRDRPTLDSPSAGSDQEGDDPTWDVNRRSLNDPSLKWAALIDRGANGCIAGQDMKVIERTIKTIDLSGIDDHTVRNLSIVTAGGVTKTPQGEVILILNQAADMTKDARTILSAGQLEYFGCKIQDKSPRVQKEEPVLVTSEGYKIPIMFRKGLPYIRLRPFDEEDWKVLPHIHITSPKEWNPASLDFTVRDDWYEKQPKDLKVLREGILTELGELKPDLEDSDTIDDTDRGYKSVDDKS